MTRARDVADTQENNGGGVAPFVAGKNKIINGDFGVWQRGTTFTSPGAGSYTADRFREEHDGTTSAVTVTRQTFALGTAPVAGYEGAYFLRDTLTTVGNGTYLQLAQFVEDVRTFAGQTVTLSFWAKADSARTSLVFLAQQFGSGGSSTVYSSTPSITYSTSWQRFSYTFDLPSIAGKTIGTGSSLAIGIRSTATTGSVLDVWGVQLEAGSVATPFTTASGSIAGELALCQRYYQKSYSMGDFPGSYFVGPFSLAIIQANVPDGVYYNHQRLLTRMRVAPTVVIYSAAGTLNKMTTVSGGDLANNSALTNSVSEVGFGVVNNSGGALTFSSGGYLFNYTASAEL